MVRILEIWLMMKLQVCQSDLLPCWLFFYSSFSVRVKLEIKVLKRDFFCVCVRTCDIVVDGRGSLIWKLWTMHSCEAPSFYLSLISVELPTLALQGFGKVMWWMFQCWEFLTFKVSFEYELEYLL